MQRRTGWTPTAGFGGGTGSGTRYRPRLDGEGAAGPAAGDQDLVARAELAGAGEDGRARAGSRWPMSTAGPGRRGEGRGYQPTSSRSGPAWPGRPGGPPRRLGPAPDGGCRSLSARQVGGMGRGGSKPADRHQQPPIHNSSPKARRAGTARLEGVRSWRWTSGLGCLPGDLDQLISLSIETALMKPSPPPAASLWISMTADSW